MPTDPTDREARLREIARALTDTAPCGHGLAVERRECQECILAALRRVDEEARADALSTALLPYARTPLQAKEGDAE